MVAERDRSAPTRAERGRDSPQRCQRAGDGGACLLRGLRSWLRKLQLQGAEPISILRGNKVHLHVAAVAVLVPYLLALHARGLAQVAFFDECVVTPLVAAHPGVPVAAASRHPYIAPGLFGGRLAIFLWVLKDRPPCLDLFFLLLDFALLVGHVLLALAGGGLLLKNDLALHLLVRGGKLRVHPVLATLRVKALRLILDGLVRGLQGFRPLGVGVRVEGLAFPAGG